jgi:hypothetical protein
MPFYATELGWSHDEALSWVKAELCALPTGTPPRYFLYEHKLNQSIHKIFQGYVPWMRVRRPFLDYDLFDFFAAVKRRRLPDLYATMLRRKYLALFAGIPHQKTGRPVLSPAWRVEMERARRFTWRTLQSGLNRMGARTRLRKRSFHMDRSCWTIPDVRRRITETIMRPGSLCCGVFGEAATRKAIDGWFDHESYPLEVVAAMYSYEHFHEELATHARRAFSPQAFSSEPRSYCAL